MPNKNGQKGKNFERELERVLKNEYGLDARRPRQTGHQDVGDLHVGEELVIQAKDWANTAAALTAGTAGAAKQAEAAGRAYGVAAIKRRGKHAREAYIAMPLKTFIFLWTSRNVDDD